MVTPNGRLSQPCPPRNARANRPALPAFFLDPSLYRAFPRRRRPQLVALFNLLVAYGRAAPGEEARPVTTTQPVLAGLLGLSVRQVRVLEVDLEILGAVRLVRDLPGLRGGRGLELVPLDEWIPEELWTRAPRAGQDLVPDDSTKGAPAVENSPTAANCAGHAGKLCRSQGPISLLSARARQSTPIKRVREEPPASWAPDGTTPAPKLALQLFGFLCRRTGLSGRRSRDALPALEHLARTLGESAARAEVDRIVRAAVLAVNPGGYAFACLFPEGAPEPRGSSLRALEDVRGPGPLFQDGKVSSSGKPDVRPGPAREPSSESSRTAARENAP